MGFDFFGADVDFRLCLQGQIEVNPGRYSLAADGKTKVRNAEDPDVVRVGYRSVIGTLQDSSELVLKKGNLPGDVEVLPLTFFRSMMTRFQMEIGLSLLPKVEVEISPPSNDVALALLNSNTFVFGNILAVRFGYSRSPFESFPGRGKDFQLFFLLKPEVTFGDTLSFVLKGLGYSLAQRVQEENPVFQSRTARQVVEEIAGKYGLRVVVPRFLTKPQVVPSVGVAGVLAAIQALGEEIRVRKAWEVDKKDWQQGNKTDWEFLNEILDSIPGGLNFRIEGDRLIIGSLVQQMAGPPKTVFRWYHKPKLNASTGQLSKDDELPILRVDSDTTYAFLPASAFGVVLNTGFGKDSVRGRGDQSASVPGKEASSDRNRNIAAMADTTLTSPNMGSVREVICGGQRVRPFGPLAGKSGGMQVAQTPTEAPDLRQIAKNLAQEAEFFGNFHVTIDTIGVPTLRPGDVIRLKGFETIGTVTEKLNGLFLVKRILHTIDENGFTTRITAMRNGTPGEGTRVSGAVNKNLKERPIPVQGTVEKKAIPATDGVGETDLKQR